MDRLDRHMRRVRESAKMEAAAAERREEAYMQARERRVQELLERAQEVRDEIGDREVMVYVGDGLRRKQETYVRHVRDFEYRPRHTRGIPSDTRGGNWAGGVSYAVPSTIVYDGVHYKMVRKGIFNTRIFLHGAGISLPIIALHDFEEYNGMSSFVRIEDGNIRPAYGLDKIHDDRERSRKLKRLLVQYPVLRELSNEAFSLRMAKNRRKRAIKEKRERERLRKHGIHTNPD